jgi:hypothetical protein
MTPSRADLIRFLVTDTALSDLAEVDPGFAARRRALLGSKTLDTAIKFGFTKPDGIQAED